MQVNAKSDGGDEPEHHPCDSAGTHPIPSVLFEIGREVIDQREGDEHGEQDHGPLHDPPGHLKGIAQSHMGGDESSDAASVQDQYDGYDDQQREGKGQPDDDEFLLPPGTGFFRPVNHVQRGHDGTQATRSGPQGANDASGEFETPAALKSLVYDTVDNFGGGAGCDVAECGDNCVSQL